METSKIDVCVSMEYRIETLLNEHVSLEKSYQEEFSGIKAQLARVNQERDSLMHRLEQSEKANTALTLNTLVGEESNSEVARLQLERAQLLARITEMGVDSERRVREAVAAHASSAEAELIIEKQSRKSLECTLTDVMSELEDVKSQLIAKTPLQDNSEIEDVVTELRESLADLQIANKELHAANQELNAKFCNAEQENQTLLNSLRQKIQVAEARLRAQEREHRFEAALASEIALLRHEDTSHFKNTSPETTLKSGRESIDQNIIAMYDYVVELKASYEEERHYYKILLAENEELLTLLGQIDKDDINFTVPQS